MTIWKKFHHDAIQLSSTFVFHMAFMTQAIYFTRVPINTVCVNETLISSLINIQSLLRSSRAHLGEELICVLQRLCVCVSKYCKLVPMIEICLTVELAKWR